MGFQTDCIFTNEDRQEFEGSIAPPIYESSLFTFPSYEEFERAFHPAAGGEPHAFVYSRGSNPTIQVLERKVALLEGGEEARALASGMAAILAALLSVTRSGDHVVAVRSLYSNTFRLLHGYVPKLGIDTSFVDFTELSNVEAAVRPNTRVLYLESPANPTMQIVDIASAVALARERDLITIFDNTAATPYNQRPLDYGVDLVVHSASKYLSGHSDVVAGVVTGSAQRMRSISHHEIRDLGGILGPFEAWLILRGLRTLGLRMRAHNEAGMTVARWLERRPEVEQVLYPGLCSLSQHELASRQMRGFGSLLSIVLKGRRERTAVDFVNRLQLFGIGVSWGGFESLALPFKADPAFPPEVASELGIVPGMVRLFIGLEDVEDLIADLSQALEGTFND